MAALITRSGTAVMKIAVMIEASATGRGCPVTRQSATANAATMVRASTDSRALESRVPVAASAPVCQLVGPRLTAVATFDNATNTTGTRASAAAQAAVTMAAKTTGRQNGRGERRWTASSSRASGAADRGAQNMALVKSPYPAGVATPTSANASAPTEAMTATIRVTPPPVPLSAGTLLRAAITTWAAATTPTPTRASAAAG